MQLKALIILSVLSFVICDYEFRSFTGQVKNEQNGPWRTYTGLSIKQSDSFQRLQINYEFGVVEHEDYLSYERTESCSGGANCAIYFLSYQMIDLTYRSNRQSATVTVNGVSVSTYRYRYTDSDGVQNSIYIGRNAPYQDKLVRFTQVGTGINRDVILFDCEANVSSFSTIPECDNQVQCTEALDVVLVIDASGSITDEQFAQEMAYVQQVVDSFVIGPNSVHLAYLTFASEPQLQIKMSDNYQAISNAIANTVQQLGQTNIADALAEAGVEFQESARGNGINKFVLLVTDGKANFPAPASQAVNDMITQANSLKNNGALIYAIGVGNDVQQQDLDYIASTPTDKFTSRVGDFSDLDDTIADILAEVCEGGVQDICDPSCSNNDFYCGCTECICTLTEEDCNNHGTLDVDSCTCDCNDPWTGTYCNTCTGSCGIYGTRNPDDCSCECDVVLFSVGCDLCLLNCGDDEVANNACNDCVCEFNNRDPNDCTQCAPNVCPDGTPNSFCSGCSACDDPNKTTSSKCQTCDWCVNGDELDDCVCECDDDWTGPKCDICDIAPTDCQNGSTLNDNDGNCECVCEGYWSGERCEICDTNERGVCNGNGHLGTDSGDCGCVCDDPNFSGDNCEICCYEEGGDKVCAHGEAADDCSRCICEDGWTGEQCDVCDVGNDPNNYCGGYGNLQQVDDRCICLCDADKEGDQCKSCVNDCSGNGTPQYPNCDVCVCDDGFTEESNCFECDTSELSDYCRGRGQITEANAAACDTCTCEDPWGGKTCNQCNRDCNGHGTGSGAACDVCDCDTDYFSPNDDCAVCSLTCANDGTPAGQHNCERCDCTDFWNPSSNCAECDQSKFSNCQNGATGDVDNCVCDCADLWSGQYCNQCTPDPNACGTEEQGFVLDDTVNGVTYCKCECAGYWQGDDCTECSLLVEGENGRACQGREEPYTEQGECNCQCPNYLRQDEGCTECILTPDQCANPVPNSSVSSDPDECYCECIEYWDGRYCDECILTPDVCHDLGTVDDEPVDEVNCNCNCEEDWEGRYCDECVLNISQCVNEVPGSSVDRFNCECNCRGGWEGRHCDVCPLVDSGCEEGYSLDLTTCTCKAVCGDGFVVPGVEDCDNGNLPSTDPEYNQCCNNICHFSSHKCDDGNACTTDDVCNMMTGECVGTSPVTCTPSNNPCVDVYCDMEKGCVTVNDNTNTCDDGDDCTNSRCVAGSCVRTAVDCSDGVFCTLDVCEGGQCFNPPRDCITLGNKNNKCVNEYCDPDKDACVTEAVECSDNDVCTTDVCRPNVGCVFTDLDCDDGDACTTDYCDPDQGGCVHDEISCQDDDPCTINTCHPKKGCLTTNVICTDGDRCTDDYCDRDANGCVFEDKNCDDGDDCTIDACVKGVCTHTYRVCEDESQGCSLSICIDGECQPASDVPCDDANACTADICQDDETCTHTAVSCPEDGECVSYVCNNQSGECEATYFDCPTRDDGCGVGTCNEDGTCSYESVECDDQDPCTNDACEDGVCVHTLIQDACNDNDPCTIDTCDAETGCSYSPMCSDSEDPCFTITCVDGTCVENQISCDDNDACTEDYCEPGAGCRNDDITFTSDDGCYVAACVAGENGEPTPVYDHICNDLIDQDDDDDSCSYQECVCGLNACSCAERTRLECNIVGVTGDDDVQEEEEEEDEEPQIVYEPSYTTESSTNGTAIGAIVGGTGSGNGVQNDAEQVIAGTYSTLTVAGVGSAVVACFAFFAVVFGLNNTKKDTEVPIDALLESEEGVFLAENNPLNVESTHFNNVMHQ